MSRWPNIRQIQVNRLAGFYKRPNCIAVELIIMTYELEAASKTESTAVNLIRYPVAVFGTA